MQSVDRNRQTGVSPCCTNSLLHPCHRHHPLNWDRSIVQFCQSCMENSISLIVSLDSPYHPEFKRPFLGLMPRAESPWLVPSACSHSKHTPKTTHRSGTAALFSGSSLGVPATTEYPNSTKGSPHRKCSIHTPTHILDKSGHPMHPRSRGWQLRSPGGVNFRVGSNCRDHVREGGSDQQENYGEAGKIIKFLPS